jgi:hypothetical protein
MKLNLGTDGKPAMAENKLANAVRDLKRVKEGMNTVKDRVATSVSHADAAFAKMHAAADGVDLEVKEAEALLSELNSNFGPELDELEVAPPKKGLFGKT